MPSISGSLNAITHTLSFGENRRKVVEVQPTSSPRASVARDSNIAAIAPRETSNRMGDIEMAIVCNGSLTVLIFCLLSANRGIRACGRKKARARRASNERRNDLVGFRHDRRRFGLGRQRRRLAVYMLGLLRYRRLRDGGCRHLAHCWHLRQLVLRNRCGGRHRGFVVIAIRRGHRWSKTEQRERRSDEDSLHGMTSFRNC